MRNGRIQTVATSDFAKAASNNLDRHATYIAAAYVAGAAR